MYFDLAPCAKQVKKLNDTHPLSRRPPNLRSYVIDRANYYGSSYARVMSPFKNRATVDVRRAIAQELRDFGFSLPEIGRALRKHHTSILWMLRGGRHR